MAFSFSMQQHGMGGTSDSTTGAQNTCTHRPAAWSRLSVVQARRCVRALRRRIACDSSARRAAVAAQRGAVSRSTATINESDNIVDGSSRRAGTGSHARGRETHSCAIPRSAARGAGAAPSQCSRRISSKWTRKARCCGAACRGAVPPVCSACRLRDPERRPTACMVQTSLRTEPPKLRRPPFC